MTLDSWNSIFQVLSVVLLGLTFAIGAGAIWTGHRINQREATRLVALETDLTTAKGLLAQQQERAAKAERDLLTLRQKIAPRIISDDQRASLIAALKASENKGLVILVSQVGDSESSQYAVQIEGILKAAEWPFAAPRQAGITPSPGDTHVGLLLGVRDPSKPPPHGLALQQAFAAVGIEMHVEQASRMQDDAVELMVNNKPM